MASSMPAPLHIIQDSRYAKQDGWRLDDISLCSSGNIAVSGSKYDTYQSYVSIYGSTTTDDNSDSRDKPTLLYHKQFTHKLSWPPRYISFIKPNSTEIVTFQYNEVQVIDYNRDVVLRSRKVNGRTMCLSVSESQIFIGLGWSAIVNIYDNDLNEIKSIRLKGIRGDWLRDWPEHIAAAANILCVCTGYHRAIVYSQDSGSILTEYTTGQHGRALSIAVNVQLGLTAVLWYQYDTRQTQIIFHLLTEKKSFLTVNVESGVSRIRISDQDRIVTGNEDTGEVKVYNLVSLFSYRHLKECLVSGLGRSDCKKLADYFAMGFDELKGILNSDRPASTLLLALEEKGVIQPSNVDRLEEAFSGLEMNSSFYHAVNMYQKLRASATSYERFLVNLSAHLTASVAKDMCSHFNIPHEKSNIISNQNPGLSMLLALDKMGIINQSRVRALEQPFTNLRLVQAVAKIQEYQSMIEDERDLFQHTTGLTKEEKRHLFMKLLQKKIMSWYEAMTPVPWKKSCQWKSSELFTGSGLILTNSKTQRNVIAIDDKCKLNYTEIFSHVSLKMESRIIIEGEPGSGKTMLSSQLAYDWSQGKISDINILILLPLKFAQTKTLVEATEEFYLMEGKGLSLIDIEDVIIGEDGKCCFLLDGLEEYNGQDERSGEEISEVVKVMTKVKYPNCKVILTSRSDYAQNLPSCPTLKLGTFGEAQRRTYIEKVYSDDSEKQMKVKDVIDGTPFILDLCSVPLLFVLAVHNIGSIINIQDAWQERVSPFIEVMVETLCPSERRKNRVGVTQRYVDHRRYNGHDGDIYVHESYKNRSQGISLEILAFNGLCRGKQQLSWQKMFVEENVRNMKQYLDSGILVVDEAANGGMNVKTEKQKSDTEQVKEVGSDVNENSSGPSNIPREGDSDSAGAFIRQREPFKGAFQELQKHSVGTASKEFRSRYVQKFPDILEITEHKDVSSNKQPNVHVESKPRKYVKTSLTTQHVSLQVKFLHKVLQEWFAARYLADICWKYGDLSLSKKYKCFREHLHQINPADLHYVLRFTCALCPPSCHLILNYLLSTFRSEEGKIPGHIINCICLCLAEYDGYKGHYIKDVISEVCKADITIHSEDSRLLQRTKVSMLQLASDCKLSISQLQLLDVIIEAKGDELIFNSGTSLKILNTLQGIDISRWDYTLKEDGYANIVKFVINSPSVKEASLFFPIPPPTLEPEILKDGAGREITVNWHIGQLAHTLELTKGLWQVNVKGYHRQTIQTSVNDNQGLAKDKEQMQEAAPSSLLGTRTESSKYPHTQGTLKQIGSSSKSEIAAPEKKAKVLPEEQAVSDVIKGVLAAGNVSGGGCKDDSKEIEISVRNVDGRNLHEDTVASSYTARKTIITKVGGTLEISNTDILLVIPPNALPADKEEHEILMRYIPRRTVEDEEKCFSSNSTAVVEILPNLSLQHPVRLSLPHCLVLQQTLGRKAKIFASHHEKGTGLFWEEQKDVSYHIEDTTCIMLLNSFSWYKYCIDDEIVIAKKIVVYTAAQKPKPHDDAVRIEVGCYPDLPGKKRDIPGGKNLIVAHKKILYFLKSEKQHPLQISLNGIFPTEWQCRRSSNSSDVLSKKIPYRKISENLGNSCVFILEKPTHDACMPLCVFTASQENDIEMNNIAVQLAVNFQVLEKVLSTAGVTGNQCKSSFKAEATIAKSGGELEIPGTGVVLKIPPNALKGSSENQFVGMRIIPSRIIGDQVTSISSNSCTAVEVYPYTVSLRHPIELRLPHCLIFKENSHLNARIFTMYQKGHPAKWEIDTKSQYKLDEEACMVKLNKLCCVKYFIDDNVVKGKKITMYTAAKKLEQMDEVAELEVGFYSDIPGGGEILRMNPNFAVDSDQKFIYMREEKSPLQLSLDDIAPSLWECWFPKDKPLDIPVEAIAASIEHSNLFILKKTSNKVGSAICTFTTLPKEGPMSLEMALTVCPEVTQGSDGQPDDHAFQEHGKKLNADSENLTIRFLSSKLREEWKDVCRHLRVEESKLYREEANSTGNIKEAIYQCLLSWKQDKGDEATFEWLRAALVENRRSDLAGDIKKLEELF